MEIQDIIEKFLIQLEDMFMKYEEELASLTAKQEEAKYLKGLIEVLKVSKSGFAESIFQLKQDEKDLFLSVMKKIVAESSLEKTLEEAYNLYNLKKSGLLNQKEILPQKKEAESYIKNLSESIETYTKRYDNQKTQKEREQLKEYIENILKLGGALEKVNPTETIDDIDFLANIIEKTTLTDQEKMELLKYCLMQNVLLYKSENINIEILEEIDTEEKDEIEENIIRILNDMTSPNISPEEQEKLIEKAQQLVNENKEKLEKLNYADKEQLDNYINNLYQDKENRTKFYKSKSKEDIPINVEAAYEVQYFLSFIKTQDTNKRQDRVLISKACQRIKEILESLEITEKDTEKDFIIDTKNNIFLLMKNENKSLLEEDIDIENDEEELNTFEELLYQLENQSPPQGSRIGEEWKYLSNQKIKMIIKGNIEVLYSKPTKNDIIIIGVNKRGQSLKKQEERIKNYTKKFERLKEKLTSEEKHEKEQEKSNKAIERLLTKKITEDELLKEIFENNQEEIEEKPKTK